jgi:ABC-type branched-subunit amino acid transport system ATPase component/ABC-type branched-subunit amino acid transport system permease subunit
MSMIRRIALAAAGILWLALPWMTSGRLAVLVVIALYVPMVVGLAMLAGYAGQVSIGQAAFYGTGAYLSAISSTTLGLSPWLGLVIAVLGTVLLAYLVGGPILVLRGYYLVIGTLGFNIIVVVLMREWRGLTGGAFGISGIPALTLPGINLSGDRFTFYAATAWALFAIFGSLKLVRSRFGRSLQAIEASEAAAASLGVASSKYKLQTFAWSAALAGGSGALYAHWLGFVSPSPFGVDLSVSLLVMNVVGGIASIPGAILGTGLVVTLREALRDVVPAMFGQGTGPYEIVVFGAMLALLVIYLPEGLWPRSITLLRGRFPALAAPPRNTVEPPPSGDAPLFDVAGDPDPSTPLVATRSLSKHFGAVVAVKDISLTVHRGEILGVIGPNGAGKTTLLNMISGMLTPTAGDVDVASKLTSNLPAHRVAQLGVARSFQTPRLFGLLDVLDNVKVGRERHLRAGFVRTALGLSAADERDAAEKAQAALQIVGVPHLADQPPGSLSFGSIRHVELARATATEPMVLLLDEPASGLTGAERQALGQLIRRIRDAGVTIIFVEHDVPLVMALADRVLVMHHGELLGEGTPDEVQRNAEVIAAYLGGGISRERSRAGERGADSARAGLGTQPEGAAVPLLEVEDLRAGYGRVQILEGVTLHVREGEAVALLGSNGAGKTTLMRALTGLLPSTGDVRFQGRSVHSRRTEEMASMGICLVPEGRELLSTMTVEEHLVLGAYRRQRSAPRSEIEEDVKFVTSLFPILGDRVNAVARSLSGGQQQMLAIGRALMARPRLLLLDEPLLGLAPKVVEDILNTIDRLRLEGLSILLVEQNAAAALAVADRAYVLANGRVVLEDTAVHLLDTDHLQALLLGGALDAGHG